MRTRVRMAEKVAFLFLGVTAVVTLASLLIIVIHVFKGGVPHLSLKYLLGKPRNMGREGGIFPTIMGTLWLLTASLLLAVPIGLGAAIYLNEYTQKGLLVKIIRYFTENLAGVPSIVFGLFGFSFFVIYLKLRWSILSGALTLALMVLPTIIRATEEALAAVPDFYREGSLALGATKWQTITKVIIPCCKPGILTGLILGIGRAIGESAAIMLTVGGSLRVPTSLFDSTRTMAVHLYTLASEGLSQEKTYATGALLIFIVLVINTSANLISSKLGGNNGN